MQPVPFLTLRQTRNERNMEYCGRICNAQRDQHQNEGLSHCNPGRTRAEKIRDPHDRTSDDSDQTNHADCTQHFVQLASRVFHRSMRPKIKIDRSALSLGLPVQSGHGGNRASSDRFARRSCDAQPGRERPPNRPWGHGPGSGGGVAHVPAALRDAERVGKNRRRAAVESARVSVRKLPRRIQLRVRLVLQTPTRSS